MSDEQQYASKRERQKARRAERLEREAAAAKTADQRRRLTYGGLIVLVVLLIGGLVYSQIAARQAREALVGEVAERLEELGCTPDEEQPNLGGTHFSGDGSDLAANPPDVIYPIQPPSSGQHMPQVAPTGVYDVPIDPRLTLHNLEHGYVIAHHDPDAPADQVDALKAFAEDAIGDYSKIIVTPYYTELPEGEQFVFTSWLQRQACETFDPDVMQVFLDANHNNPRAPEAAVPTHEVGQGGVIDPDGEPLMFPPLDEELGVEDATDEAEEAGEATQEVDADGEPVDDVEAEPDADAAAPEATEPADDATE